MFEPLQYLNIPRFNAKIRPAGRLVLMQLSNGFLFLGQTRGNSTSCICHGYRFSPVLYWLHIHWIQIKRDRTNAVVQMLCFFCRKAYCSIKMTSKFHMYKRIRLIQTKQQIPPSICARQTPGIQGNATRFTSNSDNISTRNTHITVVRNTLQGQGNSPNPSSLQHCESNPTRMEDFVFVRDLLTFHRRKKVK